MGLHVTNVLGGNACLPAGPSQQLLLGGLIGRGNPVVPAIFLAFLSTLAVLMLYVLGKSMHSRRAEIFASVIGAFCYFIILHSRWLSNPNPILLSSLLLFYCLWKIVSKPDSKLSKFSWMGVGLFTGLALQMEAASAFFYIPTVVIFAIWQRKNLGSRRR